MAKILIVSQNITQTSWQLAKSLSDQQHEVIFLTGRDEPVPDRPQNIQVMTYFKTWSLLEALRLLPHLISINPQVFHLLLEKDHALLSQILLTFMTKSLPECVIATSVLHIKKGLKYSNPVRYLVEYSDIITCPSTETLHHLKGLNVKNVKQGRGVLAPVLNLTEDQFIEEADLSQLNYVKDKKYVLVPFLEDHFDPNSDFYKRLALIGKSHFILLHGSQKSWSYFERNKFNYWMKSQDLENKWSLTGLNPLWLPENLIQRAKALILAGITLSPEQMTNYYRQMLIGTCPLILDSSQSSIHASLWRSGSNCWILNKNKVSLELQALLSKDNLELPIKISEQIFLQKEAFDSPINELNRLYSRALRSAQVR